MIVKIKSGVVDLEKSMTPAQKKFYSKNRNFCIQSLCFPAREESVIISFKKLFNSLSRFKYSFVSEFKVYFNVELYGFLWQNSVKVIFLDNGDIIVSNDLDLELEPSSEPLMEEFSRFFSSGKDSFKKVIFKTYLKNLYKKTFNEELNDIIFKIALKYRLSSDKFLNDSFFFDLYNKFLLIRASLRGVFRRDSLDKNTREKIVASLSTHLAFIERFKEEASKIKPQFARELIKNIVSIEKFAEYYNISNDFLYLQECEALINEGVDFLSINPIIKTVAFHVARKIRTLEHTTTRVMAISSIMMTAIALGYYKNINRKLLSRKLVVNPSSVSAKVFSILRKHGYYGKSQSLYDDKNMQKIKDLLTNELNVNVNAFEIRLALVKELFQLIKYNDNLKNIEALLLALISEIENMESLGLGMLSRIPKKEIEELIVYILKVLKKRRRSKRETILKILKLTEKLQETFDISLSVSYLYKKGVMW